MKNSFHITESNLIGSIASAILILKKIKSRRGSMQELEPFVDLIKFIQAANDIKYKELLYDKNFIISEDTLNNLHVELQAKLSKVNLNQLIERVTELKLDANAAQIDITIQGLREVVEILLQINIKNQTYM